MDFVNWILWLSALVALPCGLIAATVNRDKLDEASQRLHSFLWLVFILWAFFFFATVIMAKTL